MQRQSNPNWRYAGIEYDDIANGIGLGAVFFTQGCPHQCPECHNPQTWSNEGGYPFTDAVLNQLLQYYQNIPYATRLTLSGGDPIANANLTYHILTEFKRKYPDKIIWLYTGYKFEQILLSHERIVWLCDVIVDGKFEIENRDITLQFKGSSNQRIIDVKKSLNSGTTILWRENMAQTDYNNDPKNTTINLSKLCQSQTQKITISNSKGENIMTLKDLHSKPLSEIIEQMEMVDLKIHSDNNGTINCIEIKYANPNVKAPTSVMR